MSRATAAQQTAGAIDGHMLLLCSARRLCCYQKEYNNIIAALLGLGSIVPCCSIDLFVLSFASLSRAIPLLTTAT